MTMERAKLKLSQHEFRVLRYLLQGHTGKVYRKGFACLPSHPDWHVLARLVARGFVRMTPRAHDPYVIYECLEAGANAIGKELPNREASNG